MTSQIFANIYLNEFDRFVKHQLKPLAYLRYGDDFVLFADNLEEINQIRLAAVSFLAKNLALEINRKNDIILKASWGVRFLGSVIFPDHRQLKRRNLRRLRRKLALNNLSSYYGLIIQNQKEKLKEFNWQVLEKYETIF